MPIFFFKKRKFRIIINGDWGLGIGDWGLGIGPNPQSPIPNPQSPIPIYNYAKFPFLEKKDWHKSILYMIYLYYNSII